MPFKSKAQMRLFGAELGRRKAGKKPLLHGLSTEKIKEFFQKTSSTKKLPNRAGKKKKRR